MRRISLLLPILFACTVMAGNPQDSIPSLHCLDGEMVASFPDSAVVRPRARVADTALRIPVVTLSNGVFLGERRLTCISNSSILRQTDSTVTFEIRRNMVRRLQDRWNLPILSVGVGLSFNATLTHKGQIFGWIDRSIDSTNPAIDQIQFSPHFEISAFRILGFRYSPGFGGNYYVTGDQNHPDKIDVPYQETRWGPYFELPSRVISPKLPSFSLRFSYEWIDGRISLETDTMRVQMIGYSGHEIVTAHVQGHDEAYSLLLGNNLFGEITLIRKDVQFHSQTFHSGLNLQLGLGARI